METIQAVMLGHAAFFKLSLWTHVSAANSKSYK